MSHIFISHAHQDRAVAEQICGQLEQSDLRAWIAHRDVPMGTSYPRAIIQAIRTCGAGVVLLTESSNHSEHVAREVERLSAAGVPLIVLKVDDVVLNEELEYFTSMHQWLDVAKDSMSEHLPIVVTQIRQLVADSSVGRPIPGPPTSPVTVQMQPLQAGDIGIALSFSELAERQHNVLRKFGTALLDYICRTSQPSEPVTRRELLSRLAMDSPGVFGSLTFRQFSSLLDEAKSGGCAPGLSESDAGVFVMEENIAAKLERNRTQKEEIAWFVSNLVSTGSRIGMDGGSTTLPLARILCARLEEGVLDNLRITTNSLSIAHAFSELTVEQGWSDENSPIQIYFAGGWLRTNTHATAWTPRRRDTGAGDDDVWDVYSSLDFAFLGANAFSPHAGPSMGSAHELAFKRQLASAARETFFLADASKAGISLPVLISNWQDPFTVVTNQLSIEHRSEYEALIRDGRILEVS